jgi:hypothetical protein
MRLRIVIPTRNRAAICATAVDCILDQEAEGVSVLVSDNSTDAGERAHLERATAELEGVTYLTPPEPLPMTAHWEWAMERALEDPSVTHVAYLPDRRVFRRGGLGLAAGVAERHPGRVVTYMYDEVRDHEHPIRIAQNDWTGKVVELDSGHLLDLAVEGEFPLALPLVSNGIVPREVVEAVRSRFGSVFASIAPDYCFAFRCLDEVDGILFLDRACGVQWALDRSHGFSQARGTATPDRLDFIADLGGRHLNVCTPLPEIDLGMNAVFNEYFYVQADPGSTKLRPVRKSGYLAALAGSIGMLDDPTARERAAVAVAGEGWHWRGARGRATLRRALRLVRFFGRRPKTLLWRIGGRWQRTALGRAIWRRAIERGATPPAGVWLSFSSRDEALDRARGEPPRRARDFSHVPTLFEPPGGARVVESPPGGARVVESREPA